MRTTVHVALILLIGTGLGLALRQQRAPTIHGPGPDDVVFTDDPDGSIGEDPIENPNPTHPPESAAWLSRFELTERSGATITSEDLLGDPYVVSFFFSRCPSICVQQNQKLKELQDKFHGKPVRFVAITVDPEYDNPERLREYAARFGADPQQWLFLTGDLTYIRRVAAEIYRQHADEQVHSERFILVDRQGAIEGFYSWPEHVQYEKMQQRIANMIDGKDT